MPEKQVKLLIEKMKNDEKFKMKILAIDNLEERIQAINREGFECSMADIQSFLENFTNMEDLGLIPNVTKACGCEGTDINCSCDFM